MAYYLYKRYKKNKKSNPKPIEPCEHQRFTTTDAELEPALFSNDPRERQDITGNGVNPIDPQTLKGATEASNEKKGGENELTACVVCADEKKEARRYRTKIILGLFMPFLVQSLDTTLISGALPFIASDFHQLSQLNWIVSAFNLTSATFIPFWGQFADIFGRYAAIQSALSSMILGSILCAAAPTTSFPMLLLGRGFQGLGCAGLMINAKIILADKVSLKENAKNNTIFSLVAGIGYGVGPVIGGWLTQGSWRWCFIINIPLGVIGLVAAHFLLRSELLGPQKITSTDPNADPNVELPQSFAARVRTIDFVGQLLFLFGMGLFILAFTWAGSYYPWKSAKVLSPLIIGVLLLLAFGAWEYNLVPTHRLAVRSPTRKAMIPLKLLWTRNAGLLIYINLITGMALYAVFYFVDLYFALIQSSDPGAAGTNLLFYTPGLGVGAYMAMFACNVWPLQTLFPLLLGTVIEPLGITLLAIAIQENNVPFLKGMLALTGVGTGIRFMPGTLHGVAYFRDQIASIVSLMSLAISLGGTLATTIMLNIFNNHLDSAGLTFNSASSSSFEAINALPPDEQAFFRKTATRGIVLAFFGITAFMWLGVFAVSGLGNVRIGKKGKNDEVVGKGSFIVSLLEGKKSGVKV